MPEASVTATSLTRSTPIEVAVRQALQRKRIGFREQYRIGPYRADFYLPAWRLVIEADGAAWHSTPLQRKHDRRRDAFMRERGYHVARLSGKTIRRNPDAAVAWAMRGALRLKPSDLTEAPRARRLGEDEEA